MKETEETESPVIETEKSNDCQEPFAGKQTDEEEQSPDAEADAPLSLTQSEVDKMIAEAEHRGYMRGRNEKIEKLMARPSMFEQLLPGEPELNPEAEREILILNEPRHSIWD